MPGSSAFGTALNANPDGFLSGSRGFGISAGETVTYELACEEVGGDGFVSGRAITAIFTPAP